MHEIFCTIDIARINTIQNLNTKNIGIIVYLAKKQEFEHRSIS